VDHRVELGAGEQHLHARRVQQVDLVQLDLLAGELHHPIEGLLARIVHVVHDLDLMASLEYLERRVRADVPSTAGQQDLHFTRRLASEKFKSRGRDNFLI
jgi:hypothetical protein